MHPMPIERRPKRRLEEQPWFWGIVTAAEAQRVIKKKGDFLVRRAVGKKGMNLVLSFGVVNKDDDVQVTHKAINLEPDRNKWFLEGKEEGFGTVYELVTHFKTRPVCGSTTLADHMNKPYWFLNNHAVTLFEDKKLGSGNFSVVVRGKYKKHDVAVKKLLAAEEALKEKEALLKEARMMSLLKSPYIIELYGVALDTLPPLLVMELMGAPLAGHLIKYGDKIDVGEKLLYCWELANGLAYIAEKKIVHRDLAARNCMFNKYGILKITDFGLSDLTAKLAAYCTATDQVPMRWMAPETLLDTAVFNEKSDVWSYGVLCNEIYSNGVKPLPEYSNFRIKEAFRTCAESLHVPSGTAPVEVATMMRRCWTMEAEQRPDFAELLMLCSTLVVKYPPPPIEEMSTQLIENVTPLTVAEYEILKEQKIDRDDSEDENSAAEVSVGQSEKTHLEVASKHSKEAARKKKKSKRDTKRTQKD